MLPKLYQTLKTRPYLLGHFLSYNIQTQSAHHYQSTPLNQVVNKFTVTRMPSQKYSLYVDSQITVGQFMQKMLEVFPNQNINISSNVNFFMNQGTLNDLKQQQQKVQYLKKQQFIDALLLNKILFYEKDQKDDIRLIYGVQISEYNLTNRLNIPNYIQEGVAQLNAQWSEDSLNLKQALSFSNIRKLQQGTLTQQVGNEMERGLLPEEQNALRSSLLQLIYIKKFDQKIGHYLPRTNKLMTQILALLSANGIFLFYLTYGYRGWDFGEPVSYLTGLMVDLVAMMGFFEANQALTTQRQKDKRSIQEKLNMRANQNMAKWRIAYFSRKIKL